MERDVRIYFKVDGIEQYITSLDELSDVLKQVQGATDEVIEATNDSQEGFDNIEQRVRTTDGAVKVLAGSVEFLAGALSVVGDADSEFIKSVQENTLGILALGRGVIDVSEGYVLLKENTQLATIAQRINNAVVSANPYVLIASAIIAAAGALAIYTLNVKSEEEAQIEANRARREGIRLANEQALLGIENLQERSALRFISKLEDEEELQRIIDTNQAAVDASENRIADAERQIREAVVFAAVTSQAKAQQTRAVNEARKVIEEETEAQKVNTQFVETAQQRLDELNAKKEENKKLTDEQVAALEAEVLARKQLQETTQEIQDNQAQLEEELYRSSLEQRELAFRDLEDDYYRRLNLAEGNEELILQTTEQYERDRLELKKQFREEDLAQERAFNEQVIQAEQNLQTAKFNAARAGLTLIGSLGEENEKLQNTLFVINQALGIAELVVDNFRTKSRNQLAAAGIIAQGAGNPVSIAAAASFLTAANQTANINTGIGIAGILAASISKFKGGSTPSFDTNTAVPQASGFNPSGVLTTPAENNVINPGDNTGFGGGGSNQPVRAYVLVSDIDNAQSINKQIENLARL